MPFSFKFLAMTAIATLLFQATTVSAYSCHHTLDENRVEYLYVNGYYDDRVRRQDVTELEATMTTGHCRNGQVFSFDATNRNCGCSDAPDVFDTTNCADGTELNDALTQCTVDTTATDVFDTTNCADGTKLNDALTQCTVDTTATDVFDKTNCGRGTWMNGNLCVRDPAALTGGSDNGQEATAEPPAAAASGSDDADTNDSSDAEIARTVFEGVIAACLLFIAYTYGARKASAAEAQHDDRRPPDDQCLGPQHMMSEL